MPGPPEVEQTKVRGLYDGSSPSKATLISLVSDKVSAGSFIFVHGPYLNLEAKAEGCLRGGRYYPHDLGGQPAGPKLLTVVNLNGTSLRHLMFEFDHSWVVPGTVPPGLSGNVGTFQALGVAADSKIDATSAAPITFH